ncbi:MAG: FIST C-terminal domain-containing protein [Defluviitaleaceae bacterium]|nr:FIST C-terminal domain-containing protein [Defluviitaleaceae bacterium]
MTKTLVSYTTEIDDAQLAVEQIKSQLNIETGLLKNSIGIVACHYEFVMSGIAQAVGNSLPFDVVGTISTSQSIGEHTDTLILTVMVITSDDVEFVKVLTPSLLSEPGSVIAESYKEAAAARKEKPALIFAFAPFMVQNSGDEYVSVISEASGGAPCFGTLAVDDTEDFSNCFLLCNGEYYQDRMTMVLAYGNLSPKFYIANISPERVISKGAIITKSAGHVIMDVNGRPVDTFFEDMGLAKASEQQYSMSHLPFLLDYNDGTPQVSKIFISLTPERYGLCAGAVPEGSTLYIAKSDRDDVLLTTGQAVQKILHDMEGASGLLIYSCISRSLTLGLDQYGEMNFVNERMAAKLPFMMACAGGEICPTETSEDKAINRFHNNAFVACLF